MKVSASWRRTVQVRPYESETLELSVEEESSVQPTRDEEINGVAGLSRGLSALGDVLIAERLRAHKGPEPVGEEPPADPDPFL